MKFHRIFAVILRFLYHFRHSVDRWVDSFYWPSLDLLLWGVTGYYFVSLNPNAPKILVMLVSAILLWVIVYRAQYEISGNILEELWERNLVNMFVTPLKFSEWIVSLIILGIIKGLLSFIFAVFLAHVLYQVKIFLFGFYLLPFFFLLILTGWSMGFFTAGLILRFGTRVQAFAWTIIWVISPFSALYYPVSILPSWAQTVARFVPTSYVFEGIREVIERGEVDPNKFFASLILNLIYFVLGLLFLKRSFNKVLKNGLVKVY